jgi:hypothetical protein
MTIFQWRREGGSCTSRSGSKAEQQYDTYISQLIFDDVARFMVDSIHLVEDKPIDP